ncbi:MAG TPA: hypothetical protein PLP29_03670 [Candidatus Ozemobacteraceae bacterium]|nr:hypothetical protein [Candidatus Ozemobacteraceae bacterium]
MNAQNDSSRTPATAQEPGAEPNVIGSIIIKTIITFAIGGVAWYFLQHAI